MNRTKKAPTEHITTPAGHVVLVQKLAQEMRRFRGRLTRTGLCQAMGWPVTKANTIFVDKMCRRWEIATLDFVAMPVVKSVRRVKLESALELAAAQRMEQIRLAKEEAATGKVPPYNPPLHLWWKETV